MFVVGLTGSIAMGKSTAAEAFRGFGVPVFDADAAVHGLLGARGAAVGPVLAAFPGCGAEGGIDRGALGRQVFGDPAALRRLEAILHPLVREAEGGFLGRAARARLPLAVLDIPLLLETGGERRVDLVAVVSAPPWVQARRVLGRPGMDTARLDAIRARQMPDALKRRRADVVIPTGIERRHALAAIRAVVRDCSGRQGRVWPELWQRRGRLHE
jgi:dephospho-CoA kinase